MKEADIASLTYGDLMCYLGLWILRSTLSGWKTEDFWSVTLFSQKENPCPYRLGELMYKRRFNVVTRELRVSNTNPKPYNDLF